MPTKTTFLNLNKIQENEYYNTDIENQNLDKIDESIKGYDLRTSTIEEMVNKRDQLQIKLSSNQQVQSVKDSFGGSCDFEIEGMLVGQLIENGDFEDDIKGWSLGKDYLGSISVHATVVWENGKLKITGNPDATATYIVPWNRPFKVALNQKYFLYTQMKSDNSECTGFDIGLYKDGGNLIGDKIVSTESSPLANKWYEVYGVVTASQHTDTDCFCLPVARYSTAGQPIANKSIYYEKVMCIPLQTEDQNLTANQLKEKYVDNGYFEGLKPLQGVCLEGTGKNYMPVQSFTLENKIYNTLVQGYLNLKSNTHYTLCAKVRNGSARITVSNGISLHAVNETSIGNKLTFNTGDNGKWSYWFTNDSDGDAPTIYDIMLVEGTEAPKLYIPHISSKVSFQDALAMLPNGVNDKIIRLNEKTTKHVYTNVGRDGIPYKLKKTDILDMDTSSPLVDRIVVSDHKFEDYLQGNAINNNAVMSKFKQVSSNEWSGSKSDINTFYFTPTKGIRITVAKNKYANIEEAKEDLQDTPLVYELEKPQYIDLSSKTAFLNSHHNYTAFSVLDGVIKDEHIPVKYNGITGFWTNDVNPNSPLTYSPWHYKVKYIIDLVELLPDGSKRSVLNFFTMNLNSTHSYGYLRGYFPADIVKKHGIDINNIYASYKTSETNNQGNVKIKYSADMPNTISSNTNAINAVGRQIDKLATKTHQTIEEYDKRTSSIEGKINKKDLLELELSSSKKVNSVKDSCGGACDFEIEGALVENLANKNAVKMGYINAGNQWSKSSNTSTILIPVKEGQRYHGKTDGNRNIVAFFDENPTNGTSIMPGSKVTGEKANPFDVVAPAGAKYLAYYIHNEDDRTADNVMIVENAKLANGYFEGLQPLRGVAVEAVGKNILPFNILKNKFLNTAGRIVEVQGNSVCPDFIRVKSNTNYTVQMNDGEKGFRLAWYDHNMKYIDGYANSNGVRKTVYTGDNIAYLRLAFAKGTDGSKVTISEELVGLSEYVSHKSSKVVFEDDLAKLPNGVADKIVRENGKTVKHVHTNVGRDGKFDEIDGTLAWEGFTTNGGSDNTLAWARIAGYKAQRGYKTTSRFGKQGLLVDKQGNHYVANSSLSIGTRGFYYDAESGGDFYIVLPHEVLPTNDLAGFISYMNDNKPLGIFELETPYTVELSDKTELINSYNDYTQFTVEDGVIEREIVSLHDTGTSYVINRTTYAGSLLKYKNKKFLSIKSNGLEILNIGAVRTDLAYGSERWEIQKNIVESQNIDVNKIYVTYVTSETNGQANAKIKYNVDMSGTISSNSNSINIVGEQVDKNTKHIEQVALVKKIIPTPISGALPKKHGLRIVNGYVEGYGSVSTGTIKSGDILFELPDIKPKDTRPFPITTNNASLYAQIDVMKNGNWQLWFGGNPTTIFLDNIRFKIDD